MHNESFNLQHALLNRLEQMGMEASSIPGFIRTLAQSFFVNPRMNLLQVNQRLSYLGWSGVDLDYHTFQLLLACLESEAFGSLKNFPSFRHRTELRPPRSHVRGYMVTTRTLLH